MPGIFDIFGSPSVQGIGGGRTGSGGIFAGSDMLEPAKPNTWDIVSMVASELQDANAAYRGQPGGYLDQNLAGSQMQRAQKVRQALMAGLISEDPAARQKAYAAAAMLGIDTKPIQQQKAIADLPKLLQSMQPTQDSVSAIPAPLPMGPQFAAQTMDYQRPGLNPTDAIAQSGSPELQAQFAPQLITDMLQRQDKMVRPASREDKIAAGLDPRTPAQINSYGQISPISDPNQVTAYQQEELKNNQAGRSLQWAQFGETKRHNQAVEDASAHPFGPSVGNGPDGMPVTGDAFLSQVSKENPGLANQVKAIANYRQAPPGRGTKQGIALLNLVNQYNPSFDATQYVTKQKARNDYGTGVQGKSVVAINNAMAHLDLLGKLGDAMHNGDIQALNALRQQWAQQTGSPAPTTFDAVRNIAAQEVVKSVVPGGGGVAERAAAAEDFKKAASPEQMHGAINGVRGLFAGQLHNSRRQYEKLTGLKDFNDFLSPETIGLMSMPIERAVGVAAPKGSNSGWTVTRR